MKLFKLFHGGLLPVLAFLFVPLMARGAVAELRYIPSESMAPTLAVHDKLLIEKMSPKLSPLKRGDIVVFQAKDIKSEAGLWESFKEWQGLSTPPPLIKRVIGLPGETLAVQGEKVWINGKALTEPYILTPPDYTLAPLKIGPNQIFVLGDNRNNSSDSHVWGVLPLEKVRGKAVFRFWPPQRVGLIR